MERLRFRTMGEILYEVMTGLLFYPRTLWRVLLWPAEVPATAPTNREGAGQEHGGASAGQPPDLVSPPLFLLISILLAHALDLFLRGELGQAAPPPGLGPLLFRAVAFSLFPLVMAAGALQRQGQPIDHGTLREPFELQCLCAAPFALSLSVAAILVGSSIGTTRLAGAAHRRPSPGISASRPDGWAAAWRWAVFGPFGRRPGCSPWPSPAACRRPC
jgi:hypothetical protein